MIKAVIFDMDGLLVNSEPLWEEVEIKLFARVGIDLTRTMTKQTMGLRYDEVVHYWHKKHPWKEPSQKALAAEFLEIMVKEFEGQDFALPGVHRVIDELYAVGMPMAIASSSPHRIINAAVKNLGIRDKMQAIHSAEHEEYGKPHPSVYIATAKSLGIHPEECVAFEDSPNGVIAAKAAKMKCIAVPDEKMKDNPVFGIADSVLSSLEEFKLAYLEEL